MNAWQKLKLGAKFLFGSFESASDYLLQILNDYLKREKVAANVSKARDTLGYAFTWLTRLAPYCPKKWEGDYARILTAVESMYDALEDGAIAYNELERLTDAVKSAYNNWQS